MSSAFSSGAPSAPVLSAEQVKEALREVNQLLETPAVLAQLEAVKAAAGPDPMMAMMIVMPTATNILAPILSKFGFAADQQGFMQFVAAGMQHKEDKEISDMAAAMRAKFIAPEMMPMVMGMLSMMAPPPGAAGGAAGLGGGLPPR